MESHRIETLGHFAVLFKLGLRRPFRLLSLSLALLSFYKSRWKERKRVQHNLVHFPYLLPPTPPPPSSLPPY